MSYYKPQSYNECTPKYNHCRNHNIRRCYRDDCYNDCRPLCPQPFPQPFPCPYPACNTPLISSCECFIGITTSATLTTTPTPLQFIPQKQTTSVTGVSPSLTFNQTGSYLVQVRVPVTTNSSYTGAASLFISPVTTGSISVSPSDFISTPLVAGLNNAQQTYNLLVNVTAAGATLSLNTGLNAAPTSGFAVLGSGCIKACRIS